VRFIYDSSRGEEEESEEKNHTREREKQEKREIKDLQVGIYREN